MVVASSGEKCEVGEGVGVGGDGGGPVVASNNGIETVGSGIREEGHDEIPCTVVCW